MIISILSKFIYLITRFTPKLNWIIIQTFPIWEDSGVAIYNYYKNKEIHKIIWLIPDKLETIPFEVNDKTIFLKRNSIRAVVYFIFSRYIFLTHGMYFLRFPKNQISINMWHGMPIKRINEVEKGKSKLVTSYTLSTSPYFSNILSEAFKVPINTILNIGLPRNTRLFTHPLIVKGKINIPDNVKTILWLPTYRKSVVGDIRVDGTDNGNVFNIPDFDMDEFNTVLEQLNMICLVKSHPMSSYNDILELSNLKIINDNWLYNKSMTLYELLSVCDILLTDISSVLIDFLLLNKPIVIIFPDIQEYKRNRGLAIENFFEDPPGPVCQTTKEICSCLENFSNNIDLYSENRNRMKLQFHNPFNPNNYFEELNKIIHSNYIK